LVSLYLLREAVETVAVTLYFEPVQCSIDNGDINSRFIAAKLLNNEILLPIRKARIDLFDKD